MRAEEIQKILMEDNGGFIAVNKNLIAAIGLNEAIVFSELVSKYNYYKKENMLNNGYMYCTYDDLRISTGLSQTAQTNAIKNLEKLNLIKCTIAGFPKKRYITVLDAELSKYLQQGKEKIEKLKEKIRGKSNIEHLYVLQDQNYKKQFKVIISPIMARYLVKEGFVIKDLKPNKHYPRETCFVFESSQELLNAMTYFQENIKK